MTLRERLKALLAALDMDELRHGGLLSVDTLRKVNEMKLAMQAEPEALMPAPDAPSPAKEQLRSEPTASNIGL